MFNCLTRRLSLPSPALVVAAVALVLGLGGTAYATSSTGTANTATAGAVAPGAFYHSVGYPGAQCTVIATAPATKGLVVTDIEVDTYGVPETNSYVEFLVGKAGSCSTNVGLENPPTTGINDFSFGPGVGIPAGQSLYALAGGGLETETYVNGYTVAASAVPTTAAVPTFGAAPAGAPER